ncbi:ATP phosphoribosyltransferase [Euzebya tangerina]|uniref:ATP phosphoribosyltransferase n=1 Tax=Euzebya tangerina TaxID=591198 RepID=UPI000E31BAB5|nr:ATP phosphoribosyltransferase [Euzebya tangerina]
MNAIPARQSTNGRARVAVPSKGRLRDEVLKLLTTAGYPTSGLRGSGSMALAGKGLELIEMRPRDAAAALCAGALDGAFIATDIAMEHRVTEFASQPLGFARSTLVVASKDDDGRADLADLSGCVVATHMPNLTEQFFEEKGVDVRVVAMGGSLEGVCAAGLADAIVDNSETGTSLRQNRLKVLTEIKACEAEFVHQSGHPALEDLELRLEAALAARQHRYVMLHLPRERIEDLILMFHGLESPTVLPLAGRDDLAAVHFVAQNGQLWERLTDLRDIGATDIVATQPVALLDFLPE